MKLPKLVFAMITMVLVLSVSACSFLDQLLLFNLFASDYKLSQGTVDSSSIGQLRAMAQSDSFYDALTPAMITSIQDKVDAVLTDGSDAQKQEAALFMAEVLIYASPAGDLLANASSLITSPPDFANDDIDAILLALLPPSVKSGSTINEAEFVKMINALDQAAGYFNGLNAAMAGDGYATSANAGEVALNAIMASVIRGIELPDGETDRADYLYRLLSGDPVGDPTFDDNAFDNIDNILNAANLGGMF